MNSKRKFKIIGGLFTVILIIAVLYGTVVYFRIGQSLNDGGIVRAGEPIAFNVSRKYKHAYLLLQVGTYGCKEKIKYYVKSPDNKILDQGEVEKDGTLKLAKEYPGYKGTWNIEFENLSEDESLSYERIFIVANEDKKPLFDRLRSDQ